ncbi:cytochrome P450 [Streptomyces boninensis]|uniref:cytochrome P450 n=1 Tax=Streptomyces boninensis TaxID=2039455 RepID=UPI003B227347
MTSLPSALDFPAQRESPFRLDAYRALREGQPVAPVTFVTGLPVWLVTGAAEVRAVLTDDRFTAVQSAPGYPQFGGGAAPGALSFLGMDDPDHAYYRRLVAGEFTVRAVQRLRPLVEQAVEEAFAELTAGGPEGDLVSGYALPVPSLVTCRQLGVPYADRAFFQGLISVLAEGTADLARLKQTALDLRAYFDGLATQKRGTPGDDLLSRLVGYEQAGQVDREQLIGIALLLLIGGYETTANMIALGVLALLTHPEQLALLRTRPDLLDQAVEEVLRFVPLAEGGLARAATADTDLGGVRIRAGEAVIVLPPAANRDPAQFVAGESFDIARPARRHFTFGFGMHQCLGQHLARLELRLAFEALITRLPGLRLAVPMADLSFRYRGFIFGVEALPVAW